MGYTMRIETEFDLKQKVIVKELDTQGIIIKLEVQPGILLYNVCYWLNGEQKYCWVQEDELDV